MFPKPGLIGLTVVGTTLTIRHDMSFLQSICTNGSLEECRFSIALGTSGTGSLILGSADTEIMAGELAYAEMSPGSKWEVAGSVVANGAVIWTSLISR